MNAPSIAKRKSTYGRLSIIAATAGIILPFVASELSGGDIGVIFLSFMFIPPVSFLFGAIFAIQAFARHEGNRALPAISLLIIAAAVMWIIWMKASGGEFFHLNC
jgi:hypothetical protein